MGLLYSDLQVMGSLYVARPPLPRTHLIVHLDAVPFFFFSIVLRNRDAATTETFTLAARIAGR